MYPSCYDWRDVAMRGGRRHARYAIMTFRTHQALKDYTDALTALTCG